MSKIERTELSSALLRYCELDSTAMVMIFEEWREWLVISLQIFKNKRSYEGI